MTPTTDDVAAAETRPEGETMDFAAIAFEYAGHLREAATDALQDHADACSDPELEHTGERPDLHDAECEVNANMLAAVLDDWGIARAERDALRAQVEELTRALHKLNGAAKDAHRLGAVTGPQWVKLGIAITNATAALSQESPKT